MGFLSDGFAEFRITSGHRRAAEYYLREFVRALSEKDCAELLELDSTLAVATGAFEDKEQYEAFRSQRVEDSYDLSVIGNVLDEVVACDLSGGSELMDEFLKRLDPHLSKPEFCATIIATRLFHQIQAQLFVEEIENLLGEARQAVKGDAEDEEDELLAPIAMEHLQRFLNEAIPMDWQVYDHMLERSKIQQRHSFVASEYTLFLNREELRQLVKPTEILIAESARHPDLLFKIEPRTMEKLIADIFRSFGYEVELTAQTRDGGKDVVCLSRAHGVPLKLALEVKRYAPDRPIAVDLVRSFVGANAEIKANKLIYVSTSGYTKDATDYAGLPLNSHLLELKGLDDVIEWCRDCSYKRFGKRLFLE